MKYLLRAVAMRSVWLSMNAVELSGHNGGDTRGFHYVQGGYYRKGFNKHGSLSNPYSLVYLLPMPARSGATLLAHDVVDQWYGTAKGHARFDAVRRSLHGTLVHTR